MKVWYCILSVQLKPVSNLKLNFFANEMSYVLPACKKYFQKYATIYTGDITMLYTVS
jgi:hypothetical protein